VSALRGAAALLLAGGVGLAQGLSAAPAQSPCAQPRHAGARGALASVRCDGRGGPALEDASRLLFALPLDLNRADARALEALPGIGAGRAAAIVRARPFCGVGELARVSGLGPAIRARVAPYVTAHGCVRP
jgi:competence protein ComEA